MMTDAQLQARDAQRDIAAELLQAVRELQSGQVGRKTLFETLPDDSVRRTIAAADGTVQQQDVLSGPHFRPQVDDPVGFDAH